MRWGVSDSMGPLANDICIEEIRKCNHISFGPSFVVNNFSIDVNMYQLTYTTNLRLF